MPTLIGGLRVLPRKILVDTPGEGPGDSFRLALALDRHLALLMHLDGVDLGRPLVEGPQIAIDADLRDQAFLVDFEGADRWLGIFRHRIGRADHRYIGGRFLGRQHLRRIGQRDLEKRYRLITKVRRRFGDFCHHGIGSWRHNDVTDVGACQNDLLRGLRGGGACDDWLAEFHDGHRTGALDRGRASIFDGSADVLDGSRTEAREPGENTAREGRARESVDAALRPRRQSPWVHDPASQGSA